MPKRESRTIMEMPVLWTPPSDVPNLGPRQEPDQTRKAKEEPETALDTGTYAARVAETIHAEETYDLTGIPKGKKLTDLGIEELEAILASRTQIPERVRKVATDDTALYLRMKAMRPIQVRLAALRILRSATDDMAWTDLAKTMIDTETPVPQLTSVLKKEEIEKLPKNWHNYLANRTESIRRKK